MSVRRYRTKSPVVQAYQVGSAEAWPNWFHASYSNGWISNIDATSHESLFNWCTIRSLDGKRRVDRGDWIVSDAQGNLARCDRRMFEETYALIEGCDARR
ncbi:hypothetical protein [Paraburkholderia sp. RL17-337-BIB-A]|uniref:hypothetical protein n=1 Tax=Paraburkholderia sp. RL17-337-BIB-A TaxID=3031636 RepID=UPI0038B7C987